MTRPVSFIKAGRNTIVFTDRELEFLKFCAMDITLREIAVRMGKSARTIDGYRDELFKKLKVRSTRGILLWGFKNNFLNKEDIILFPNIKKKRR